jgi:hypothetical protein
MGRAFFLILATKGKSGPMSYTDTMLHRKPGMPRQRTLQRLCLLYDQSQGTQPDIRQIMEQGKLSRRAAIDYSNAMRRITLLAQTIGKTDPEAIWLRNLTKMILRYIPRDNRPTLRRPRTLTPKSISLDLVNIADMSLLSDAHIAVKQLTCPGPARQRITYTKCPFHDLDEKEKASCEKCQEKGYDRKLTEWKARVSIVIERRVFEESVLRCAREVEARTHVK